MTSKAEDFSKATNLVKTFKSTPPDNTLLDFYGLYKQATIGDNNTPKPSFWDVKGLAKWNAWNLRKNMTKDQAMDQYIELVNAMKKSGW